MIAPIISELLHKKKSTIQTIKQENHVHLAIAVPGK